jgi:5-methylthioadenosine/S-adenosylhomocysteine deaminase
MTVDGTPQTKQPHTTQLVRGRWVVTGAADADRTLSDGAVLIQDGSIVEVGDSATLRSQHPDASVLGSERVAVVPGMISGHHHAAGVSHIQQGVPDDVLEPWLLELRRMRPTDAYLDALLTSTRLLRSGVTSVVEMHQCRGSADAATARIGQALRGFQESGIRVAFAPGVANQNPLINAASPAETAAFMDSLPPEARTAAEAFLPGPDALQPDAYLALMDTLSQQYADHPRIDIWYGPPGPNWVTDDFLVQIAECARTYQTGIQTHVSESLYEKLYGPRTYGVSVVEHLRAIGVLGPRFSLAHAVWLTDAEIEILVETGTSISHNPSSNLRLRAGIAPARALLAAGGTLGLGLDGHGFDDDDDIFREMRVATWLQRGPEIGTPTLAPREALHLATAGGAHLLGKSGQLGRLAPGYAADLVLVDLERLSWPWIASEADPRDLLVLRAQARDVRTVMIGGEIALQDGRPTGFDVDAVTAEFAAKMAAAPFPEEAARRIGLLKRHIEAFYASWDLPELEPYIPYNSRT